MSEAELKETDVSAVGPNSAVVLKNGRLHWAVALDERNRFSGAVELPKGVSAASVVGLGCDRSVISLVTNKGELFTWSHNGKCWVGPANLFSKALQ